MDEQEKEKKMIVQYGKSKAQIDERTFVLSYDGTVLIQQPTAQLVEYSLTRPFQITANDWQFVDKTEKDGQGIFRYRCGDIAVRLEFQAGEQALHLAVTFTNEGAEEIADFAGGVVLPITGRGHNKMTLPNMIYNDNPSAVPEKIVPHIGDIPGEGIIVEEHRLPILSLIHI